MIQGGVIPNGKKGKRDGFCTTTDRSKLPKPNKRVALSTISQNAGCRIQPSRAAKGKLSVSYIFSYKVFSETFFETFVTLAS